MIKILDDYNRKRGKDTYESANGTNPAKTGRDVFGKN